MTRETTIYQNIGGKGLVFSHFLLRQAITFFVHQMALTATSGMIIWKMLKSAAPYLCDHIFACHLLFCYI